MKKLSKKNIIIISIIVIIVVVALVYFLSNNTNSNTKTNKTNEEIQEDVQYDVSIIPDGIKIKNEKIEIEGEELNFSASIKNTLNEDIYVKEVEVVIRDSEKNIIADFTTGIGDNIAAKSSLDISGMAPVTNGVKYNEVIYIFNTNKTDE